MASLPLGTVKDKLITDLMEPGATMPDAKETLDNSDPATFASIVSSVKAVVHASLNEIRTSVGRSPANLPIRLLRFLGFLKAAAALELPCITTAEATELTNEALEVIGALTLYCYLDGILLPVVTAYTENGGEDAEVWRLIGEFGVLVRNSMRSSIAELRSDVSVHSRAPVMRD